MHYARAVGVYTDNQAEGAPVAAKEQRTHKNHDRNTSGQARASVGGSGAGHGASRGTSGQVGHDQRRIEWKAATSTIADARLV